MHIYESASWWQGAFANWWENDNQSSFTSLMKQYRDKIVMEVSGHDHLSGLRFHEVEDSPGEYYLNKVLFPSVTPSSNT